MYVMAMCTQMYLISSKRTILMSLRLINKSDLVSIRKKATWYTFI